jgi:hypothetical protein
MGEGFVVVVADIVKRCGEARCSVSPRLGTGGVLRFASHSVIAPCMLAGIAGWTESTVTRKWDVILPLSDLGVTPEGETGSSSPE